MSERLKIGAYFYPNEPSCPFRQERNQGAPVVSEFTLAREAKPLFPKHDQPRSYCLGDLKWTDWDDSNPNVLRKHIELAHEAGLDFFAIDTYLGIRGDKRIQESGGFLNNIAKLKPSELEGLSFATTCCFRSPRTILPMLPKQTEPGRSFEPNIETARYIVDKSFESYWQHPNYLHVKGRPYVSIFTPGEQAGTTRAEQFRLFMQELKDYALKMYKIEPYLAGIISHSHPVADAKALISFGVDAIAGYANLAEFSPTSPVVLDHQSLINARLAEWEEISKTFNKPIEPSAVIGLDASPRCIYTNNDGKPFIPTSIEDLKPFAGIYPHSPIVTNSTPAVFAGMLTEVVKLTSDLVPKDEQLVNILAWNEASEGGCALPRIRDGEIDWSYIRLIRSITRHSHE